MGSIGFMFKFKKRSTPNARRHVRTLCLETLEPRQMLAFAHPGLLYTDADFDRMATKVAAQAEPWLSGYQALISNGYAQPDTNPRPLQTVIRGGAGQNFNQMVIDIQRAYMLALRWKVSGNTVYADKAVEFLNAWQYTMTSLTGNADRYLAAGIYGYEWANIAEIMRTYSGWSATDADNFGDWLVTHFYSLNHEFLLTHNGAAITNYWANWDLCNIASMMAIGVYTDDQAMYDEAIDYLNNGGGNGALDKFVYYVHDGNLGQWQESGRDQGHTVFGVSLVGPIMQMAWNQGLDLYSYDNNRFLAGAEYVAKYNLGYDVPFEQYSWGTGQNGTYSTQTVVSSASRGNAAPGYELVYNHYVNLLGIDAPYSQERVQLLAPEGASGNGDQFGFGTLTYTLDPYPEELSKPSGLTAVNFEDTVKLDWWGAVYADSYNVYRATSENGVYTQIASGISDLLTYADHGMPDGEYFYKVTGVIDGNETDSSNVVQINTATEFIAHLQFDETTGTSAADSTGNGVTGTLNNGASWTTGNEGNAVDLSGSNQYVSLPDDIIENLSDFTIAAWVKVESTSNWMRIFDFGDSNGRYMFLTPRAGDGKVRFAIGTNYYYNEDFVEGTAALPTNQWVHVAVTLSGKVGRLYVNGELVGANAEMNLTPFQVGGTSQNWIGRSQYGGDPYLNGQVDDFRIYSNALPSGDIYELATGTAAPAVPAAPTTLNATAVAGNTINLSWAPTTADYYNVKRAAQAGGPYYTVATLLNGTTYADANLTAGSTYYYVVTAANEGGESIASPQANATALPPLPGIPANLSAGAISASKIKLAWTVSSDAESYNVQRATTSGGPYTTIATGLTATDFTDSGLAAGEAYYYVVTAVNAAGESSASNEAVATVSELSLRLKFDETSGTAAADSSGNGWAGALLNGPLWVAGRIENSVDLDGTDDYVDLPDGVVSGLTDFTIATWVYLDSNSNWSRIFDFGTGKSTNMFLTPQNGANGRVRFAITTGGGASEQQINTTATIPLQTWTHIAVTWAGNLGILYINGNEAGRNSAMTLNPSSLGSTTQNFIGKSQYADPYLDGRIDDFRILNRALSPGEISDLAYAPQLLGDYDLDGTVSGTDFLLWQRQYQQAVTVYQQADGDGSGTVDEADLAVWSNHYGSFSSLEAFTFPLSSGEDLAQQLAAVGDENATDSAFASLAREDIGARGVNNFWLPAPGVIKAESRAVVESSSAVTAAEMLESSLVSENGFHTEPDVPIPREHVLDEKNHLHRRDATRSRSIRRDGANHLDTVFEGIDQRSVRREVLGATRPTFLEP